ncbi:hypothetical protein KIPB_007650, partial [Kipferlia bialata]
SAYVGTKPGTWQGVDTLTSKAEAADTSTASLTTSVTSLQDYVDVPSGWTASAGTTLSDALDALGAYVDIPEGWTNSEDSLSASVTALSDYVGDKPAAWEVADTLSSRAESTESTVGSLGDYVAMPGEWTAAEDTTLTAAVTTLDTYVAVPDEWTVSEDSLTKRMDEVWLLDYSERGEAYDLFSTDDDGGTFDWEGEVYWYMVPAQDSRCLGSVSIYTGDGTWKNLSTQNRAWTSAPFTDVSTNYVHIQKGQKYKMTWHTTIGTCSMVSSYLKRL